jgi:hypothetical protein
MQACLVNAEKAPSLSTSRIPKDIQAVVAELRERQERRRRWKEMRPNPNYPKPIPDIDKLLSIIDSLAGEIERLEGWRKGLQATTLSWADAGVDLYREGVEDAAKVAESRHWSPVVTGFDVAKAIRALIPDEQKDDQG